MLKTSCQFLVWRVSWKCVVTYQYCTVIMSSQFLSWTFQIIVITCVLFESHSLVQSFSCNMWLGTKKKKKKEMSVPCGWLLSTKMALEAWICLKGWICFSAKALFLGQKWHARWKGPVYVSCVWFFFFFFFEVQERGNPFGEWTPYRPLFIVWLRLDGRMTSHDIAWDPSVKSEWIKNK